MRVTLIGFTVSSQHIAVINSLDRRMPYQTHRFAWALVGALRSQKVPVELLSFAPVSNYPANKRVLWPRERFEESGVTGEMLPFANVLILKHISRFISALRALLALPKQPDRWTLVHGVHTPLLLAALIARWRRGDRAAAVLTDPPGVVLIDDGIVVRSLKRLDRAITKVALKRFNAVIVLAHPLSTDLCPDVPALLMDGLHSPGTVPRREPDPRPLIIYAGALRESYGVANLVSAVVDSNMDCTLAFFGKGPAEEVVSAAASRDPRVLMPCFVSPVELSAWYSRATVLVQPRPVEQEFTRYSFPSKLIEYVATGVPVISTRLPAIPDDYANYVIWSGDTPDQLASAIKVVLAMDATEREEFGTRAKEFIDSTRSVRAQGERIVGFLARL